jgi:hypothetical protein
MKVFHCDHCGHLLFFENTVCLHCGRRVAFLPDLMLVGSLDAAPSTSDGWQSPLPHAQGRVYHLCRNYSVEEICNWCVPHGDGPLCTSCRLTRMVPDLSQPSAKNAWYRLETAKRRLMYTLMTLGLPVAPRSEDPVHGLSFEFQADSPDGTTRVTTGHANGVITINIAEADDAEREKHRASLHEPYRTLLGHMRHESGHYYWARLIDNTSALPRFREVFGDERRNYAEALAEHYKSGPCADWQSQFISAYATSHPWEDWAETWAHYLHIVDTLEMAAHCGLSLRPWHRDEPSLPAPPAAPESRHASFDGILDSWYPVAYVLNNLNRGLGLADAYPFVLSAAVIDKLRFVHGVVHPDQSRPAG